MILESPVGLRVQVRSAGREVKAKELCQVT